MTRQSLSIAMVGGSMAGVFAGALLAQRGHRVTIFERARGLLQGRGQGVTCHRDLDEILHRLGCEAAGAIGVAVKERVILDSSGAVIDRHVSPQVQLSWDRLHREVRTRVPDGQFRRGQDVEDLAVEANGVRLRLAGGEDVAVDLVMAPMAPSRGSVAS